MPAVSYKGFLVDFKLFLFPRRNCFPRRGFNTTSHTSKDDGVLRRFMALLTITAARDSALNQPYKTQPLV